MPHVVFVPFTGFRVREEEMRELGQTLPGFKQRAAAIAKLPALGVLTLAECSRSHGAAAIGNPVGWPYYTLFDVTYQPDLMSVSELEAGFREVLRQVFSSEATRRRQKIRHHIWHQNTRLSP